MNHHFILVFVFFQKKVPQEFNLTFHMGQEKESETKRERLRDSSFLMVLERIESLAEKGAIHHHASLYSIYANARLVLRAAHR